MFGIIIPGVSNKKTNGSSETRIFVCKALVIPGLAPTFIGFPFNFKVELRIKLIKDDLPTLGMPQISKLESGENFLLNRSFSVINFTAVGKTDCSPSQRIFLQFVKITSDRLGSCFNILSLLLYVLLIF